MKRFSKLTAIDVGAVVLVCVFAAALLVPVCGHARGYGKEIVCLSNLHGLSQAWLLYAKDNDDEVGGATPHGTDAYTNEPYPAYPAGPSRRVWNFVGSPHDENGKSRNEVLEDELRGIRNGALWSYVRNEKIYHSPADKRYLTYPTGDQASGGGMWGLKGGYRTYSLGAVWNCYSAGWQTGENEVMTYKTSEIVSPESKIVWIEESDGSGYNGNTWNFFLNTQQKWGDPLAVFHSEQTSLSYADGHAELHKWQNESTIEMGKMGVKQYPIPPGETDDIKWFRIRYVPGNMPPHYVFE